MSMRARKTLSAVAFSSFGLHYWFLTLPAMNDGGSWFNEGACTMNTTTHSVEVPFPQAFTEPKSCPFPSAPRYGTEPGLPGLSEALMRSNQTARCDECASTQTRIEFSRCCLALCELAMWSASILSPVSRLSLNNHRWNTQQLNIPTLSTQRKERPFIPRLRCDGGFLGR